ncbi:MAG: ThuA domain-containing protein [Prolixibacteraceae bacterium]|jgi:uncharacterized protein|nr:ThuA domain-containing protein [Prolixibacteraceae bacterium]MBT6007545.1 ThuA domain-containing protein [Prolixibacteraceae bacterium]MBT6765529.1 ThuA domain-containing protein [Prolixibacteraceae bacterium]MBT6999613.1 ThuA domain-containing protein [Prolixibacteraceae bacterium]MBT7394966.1 ThuA domain-containing protein [Prolixibacteraceae bacterium]
MKKVLLFVGFLFVFVMLKAQPVKIMLVTGGHAFDTIQFFQMFDALDGIEYEHFVQPNANAAIVNGVAQKFDVLVFYDMWKTISENEKSAYLKLTKQGKPFLFLHHTLVSYQDWGEFEKLLGGKYIQKSKEIPVEQQSTYVHDVWVEIEVINDHPVTKGFDNFKIFDEVYGNFIVSDKVTPLLKTNHPQSSEIIAWENSFNSSKIVYLQPGHDFRSFESEDFRKLILQSIKYLANSN